MVQTYAIFYSGESQMLEMGSEGVGTLDDEEKATLQHNTMHQMESITAAPLIFVAILMGLFYEIYSRRAVLLVGFLVMPISLLFFWSTSFAMTAIAKIVVMIGCQTVL